MINMLGFTRNDWHGWCGAEQTNDGREPKICHINIAWQNKEWEVTIVQDKTGIGIYYFNEDSEDEWLNGGPYFNCECTYDQACWLLEKMTIENVEYEELCNNPFFQEDKSSYIRKSPSEAICN